MTDKTDKTTTSAIAMHYGHGAQRTAHLDDGTVIAGRTYAEHRELGRLIATAMAAIDGILEHDLQPWQSEACMSAWRKVDCVLVALADEYADGIENGFERADYREGYPYPTFSMDMQPVEGAPGAGADELDAMRADAGQSTFVDYARDHGIPIGAC